MAGVAAPDREARKEQLLKEWDEGPLNLERRDALLKEMQGLGLFPRLMEAMDEWEESAGLYPDLDDPRFSEKLMAKLEFAEAKQKSMREQEEEGANPCGVGGEFELTPVQRFVGRFLSPQCPYQSALFFHGVGVGKTCAAITVAENYLNSYPRRSVFIVAPRIIQAGFRTELFNEEELKIGEHDEPNQLRGCTGSSYLKRTGMEFERDKKMIVRAVNESIKTRYTILGYIQFHRYIEDILKKVPAGLSAEDTKAAQNRLLRREFSGRLVIIDEAHNLRDSPAEAADDDVDEDGLVAAAATGEDVDAPGGETELAESKAGKRLTPSLLRVLQAADGMKLILATATPMYNSYKEILFLLNMLLINDKRDDRLKLSESQIFLPNGEFRKAADGTPIGEQLLGAVASAYVSFMRGENPLSFPVRLPPMGVEPMKAWPARGPLGDVIPEDARKRMSGLPFVPVQFEEGPAAAQYEEISSDAIETGGVGISSIDEMVQAGNWLFPGEEGVQIRDLGFDSCFEDSVPPGGSGQSTFKSRMGAPTWLLADNLGPVSPKTKLILQRLRSCRGVAFIYSRFIKSGALPLALALEANGYTPWGDRRPLLADGILDGKGRQCALCSRRERGHGNGGAGSGEGVASHRFAPAKYVLITGKASISKNNPVAVDAARAKTNLYGEDVKVIIGSSVASEGVNFKFVREIYVFDSWFHLNKMEQVLGRGVRYCSHSLLPKKELRNCTIHLLVNTFGEDQDTETADLYMYRNAMTKALRVGQVTRVLKRYALDCNLNRDAIIVTGLATQRHVDSQGKPREAVNVNDTPFTAVCDWIECAYKCAKPIEIGAEEELDTSTYDEYAARWRETELKKGIRQLFAQKSQPQFAIEEISEALKGVPMQTLAGLMSDIVGNRSFQVSVRGLKGYIVYRNGYYLFQPDYLADVRIPMALRLANVPVRKDVFTPETITKGGPVMDETGAAATVARVAAPETATAIPAAPSIPENLIKYWDTMVQWAAGIQTQTARKDDLPEEVLAALTSRYSGDEQKKEREQLIMINWLYEHIVNDSEYGSEKKTSYLKGLARILLEFVWDESLKWTEQEALLYDKKDSFAAAVAKEQIIRSGSREAFRYVDPVTGVMKYRCGNKTDCEPSLARVFDTEETDPLKGIAANMETSGPIYGFMVPKGKEGRLVFKTNHTPSAPGVEPGKGRECTIVSTISNHIRTLKEVGDMFDTEGFPRFLLTEDVLEGRDRGKRPEQRQFKNANRACALVDIVLRWLNSMIEERGATAAAAGVPQRRYFYRPIASFKSKHKGTVIKGK